MGEGGGNGTGAPLWHEPKSLAAFLRLCEEHGDILVSRQDSLDAENCTDETDRFIKYCLQGRTVVHLSDLIPFVRRGHDYWGEVMDLVVYKLIRAGTLHPEYYWYLDGIREPARKRKVDLYPRTPVDVIDN